MIPALCCACGTSREVRRQAFTISGNRRLKCATCKAMTMHALVLNNDRDDWREDGNRQLRNLDHIYDQAGSQPALPVAPEPVLPASPTKTSGAAQLLLDAVRTTGVRLIEVEDLEQAVIYVHAHRIALIRRHLDDEYRERAAAWLLMEAVREA